MARAEIIRRHFDRAMRLLELGPSYNPVVHRRIAGKTVIAHADQAELIAKYDAMSVATDRIEPVDYVWQSGSLIALIHSTMHGSFDGLVASHVGEHFPDLIAFFHDASELVKPQMAYWHWRCQISASASISSSRYCRMVRNGSGCGENA